MPIRQVRNEKKKLVPRYYLHDCFVAQSFTDADLDRLRQWRKDNATDNRIVKAANIVLGWLGDEKQKFIPAEKWPVELVSELDRATWKAEGLT
jgi:hypothetical protein